MSFSITFFVLENDAGLEAESISKPKERPIASRRSYVTSLSKGESSESNEQNGDSPNPVVIEESATITDSSYVEPSNSSTEANATENNSSNSEVKEAVTTESSNKVEFTPKAVKEIEKEIAENTAKFDAQTLKKDDKKSKGGKSVAAKIKVAAPSNIQPASVLKFLRVALLLIVGVHIGVLICF